MGQIQVASEKIMPRSKTLGVASGFYVLLQTQTHETRARKKEPEREFFPIFGESPAANVGVLPLTLRKEI